MGVAAVGQRPVPQQARVGASAGVALIVLGVVGAALVGALVQRKQLIAAPVAVALSGAALALCCHRLGRRGQGIAPQLPPAAPPAEEEVPDVTAADMEALARHPLNGRAQPLLEETTRGLLKLIDLEPDLAVVVLAHSVDRVGIQPLRDRLDWLSSDGSVRHSWVGEVLWKLYGLNTHSSFERLNWLRDQLVGLLLDVHSSQVTDRRTVGSVMERAVGAASSKLQLEVLRLLRGIVQGLNLPDDAPWLFALPPDAPAIPENADTSQLLRQSMGELLEVVGAGQLIDRFLSRSSHERYVGDSNWESDDPRRDIVSILNRVRSSGRNDFERLQWLRVKLATVLHMWPDRTPRFVLFESAPAARGVNQQGLPPQQRARAVVANILCRLVREQNLQLDALWAFAMPQPRRA
jgi:hypothetical protein